MADQKLLLGNVRGPQGPAGPNTVSSSTTTSGFENGHVLFNNNGKVGAKKLSASDVGAAGIEHTHNYAGAASPGGNAQKADLAYRVGESYKTGHYADLVNRDYTGLTWEAFFSQTRFPVACQRLQCVSVDGEYYYWALQSQFNQQQGCFRLSCIGDTGEIVCFVDVAGRVSSASSKRYKSDIKPVQENLLDAFINLDVIDFLYNEAAPENVRDNKRHFGVIAEQVAKIMPDSVTLDGEGLPSAVVYSDFIPLLLAQLQRQQKQLAALEQRIRQLEEGNRE